VAGYVGSLFTVIYTWRLIFRAFWGEPVEQAVELEHGHLWHAPHPFNPANGELEDTEVGFPGPEHHIAEQSWQMKAAMSVLALLSIVAGVLELPFNISDALGKFLAPTFADSIVLHPENNSLEAVGLVLSSVIAIGGIWVAYVIWVQRPGTSARILERTRPLYELFVNKWYFDELIELVVVRPFAWFGRWGRDTFERIFVDGALVGGTSGIVRAGSAAVRALQTGLLRSYAGLVVAGLAAVVLYFLIRAA